MGEIHHCFGDLWDTLLTTTATFSFFGLVWACVMLVTIFIQDLKLAMIKTLCWLQIGASISATLTVFFWWNARGRKIVIDSNTTHCGVFTPGDQDIWTWLMFTFWMIFTSLRHLLFDIKNWKVSMILVRMQYASTGIYETDFCLSNERLFYWLFITCDILFPLSMFIAYVATKPNGDIIDKSAPEAFFILWVITWICSLYYLLTAYFKINKSILEMAQGQIKKWSILLMMIGQILYLSALIAMITFFDEKNFNDAERKDMLSGAIAAVVLQSATIMVQMYNWQRIIWIAISMPRQDGVYSTQKSDFSSFQEHEYSEDQNKPEYEVNNNRSSQLIDQLITADTDKFNRLSQQYLGEQQAIQKRQANNTPLKQRENIRNGSLITNFDAANIEEECFLRTITSSFVTDGTGRSNTVNFILPVGGRNRSIASNHTQSTAGKMERKRDLNESLGSAESKP